jgi:hypothetical protein
MPSFLSPLLRYAPRPGRLALEDFFTEAFAGILRADSRLLPAILRHGEGHPQRAIRAGCDLRAQDPVTIRTQYWMSRTCKPDLVVFLAGEPQLIVESKFGAGFTGDGQALAEPDSPAGENSVREPTEVDCVSSQIPRYVKEVKRQGGTTRVLLISLWPREIPEPVDPTVYLGNLLWSDVHSALAGIPTCDDERSRVLLSELLMLMEELKMTELEPLRFGDGESYWAFQNVRRRMGELVDRVAAVIPKEFDVECSRAKPGQSYWYCEIKHGELMLDIGVIVCDQGERNAPVWPVVHVRPGYKNAEQAHAALAVTRENIHPNWPGKCALPSFEQLSRFLGPWEWEQQVAELLAIVRGWLDGLVKAGLTTRIG